MRILGCLVAFAGLTHCTPGGRDSGTSDSAVEAVTSILVHRSRAVSPCGELEEVSVSKAGLSSLKLRSSAPATSGQLECRDSAARTRDLEISSADFSKHAGALLSLKPPSSPCGVGGSEIFYLYAGDVLIKKIDLLCLEQQDGAQQTIADFRVFVDSQKAKF